MRCFCSIPRRFFVWAEPAIAIARSKAIWPLIAVAIVRRKNLRSLKIVRRLGFGAVGLSVDKSVVESVD